MILFDYIYYFFCNLYRMAKSERRLDGWKISGTVAVGGSVSLFLMCLLVILEHIFKIYFSDIYLYIFCSILSMFIFIPIFSIRYRKFTTYEKVEERLKSLSEIKQLFLNIFLGLYLAAIIGGFALIIYIGAKKSSL